MRLYACHFGGGVWDRMARVLDYSARRHCPEWDVTVSTIEPPDAVGLDPSYSSNTAKLDAWVSVACNSHDGDELCLMDADCMVLHDLSHVWSYGFDFALTARAPGSRLPFNAGVVFVRMSPGVRHFLLAWRDTNRKMLREPRYHQQWRARYGGINQAALGAVLESKLAEKVGVSVARLPCVEWNCEDSSWQAFDPAVTRVVHLKSGLRRSVFGIGSSQLRHQQLRRIWRELERQAS